MAFHIGAQHSQAVGIVRALARGLAVILVPAGCAAPGPSAPPGPSYYCAGTTVRGGTPTLVITQEVYRFAGPPAAFAGAEPSVARQFAAYVAATWPGLSMSAECRLHASQTAAGMARDGEIGRYEAQGYGIMRVGYWQPGG